MAQDIPQETFEELSRLAVLEERPTLIIFQDKDGNWRGNRLSGNSLINVRAGDPQTVLTLLITHDGK